MTYRLPVPLTDETKTRLEQYAREHGASLAGAAAALISRGLNHADREAADRAQERVCVGAPAGYEADCGGAGPHGPHPMTGDAR